MSTKVILGVVVALALAAGAWYLWSGSSSQGSMTSQSSDMQQNTNTQDTSRTSADTSDAALLQDAVSIDAQLQAASSDSSAAGSFSDTQVAQTE